MREHRAWLAGCSLIAMAFLPMGARAQAPADSRAVILLPPLPDADVVIPAGPAIDLSAHPAAPAPVAPVGARADTIINLDPPPAQTAVAPVIAPQPAAPAAIIATPAEPPAAAPQIQQATAPAIEDLLRPLVEALQRADVPRGAAGTLQRRQNEAIAAFYVARNFAPLWIANGQWTLQARGAAVRLEHADEDGLDIRPGAIPSLTATDDASRVAAELALTQAIVAYGRQAANGRLDPRAISPLIDPKSDPVDIPHILNAVAGANDGDAALQALNPPQPGYAALRQKLAELRASRVSTPAQVRIPAGPILKIGMRDPRVPLIRARLGISPGPTPDDATEAVYDNRVATAIADFQRMEGLPASGTLTPRTVSALSGGQPETLEAEILANMERWRWLPREMGAHRIEVNIPDFTLKVVDGAQIVHTARVVVGKTDTATPIFSNAMQFIIVNPYWNVPDSIIKKEMLPKLASDPNYFTRMGYEAIQKNGRLIVRQPPGERNALGRIKFMFPNDHAVYLHDTPSRSLFGTSRRAYSHGCVRVDQPLALAEAVLGRANGWTQEKFKSLIGGAERTVKLPQALPIHIEYFTAWVDENGKLQLRDDIYGYSRKVKQALGLDAGTV